MFTFYYTTSWHSIILTVTSLLAFLLIVFFAMVGKLVLIIPTIIIFIIFINSNIFHNISSYFYLRYSLKVNISYEETKEVSFLFKVNYAGFWYPLTEIKYLPEDKRKEYIYNFISNMKSNY